MTNPHGPDLIDAVQFYPRLLQFAEGSLQRDERDAHRPIFAHLALAPAFRHRDRDAFFVDVQSNIPMLFIVLVSSELIV
ncbi:MAG: hypothetical protein ACREIF_02470 [Chthoniobacterales bacterium]